MTQFLRDEHTQRETPLVHLRTVFARFLQKLFSDAPVGEFHWSPDRETTEIIIQGQNVLDAETASQRPGITIGRGPIRMRRLGLGDMVDYSFETGKTTKSALVPGVIYVNCCSRNDLESEHIAWVSMEHIWLLNEEIEQAGIFDVGRDLYIAEPAPASSLVSGNQGEEWYCTAVQVPVLFPRTSSVSPLDGGLAERVEMRTSGAGEQSSRVEDKPTFGSSERVGSGGGADGSSGRAESPHGRMTVPKRFPGGPLGV